MEVIRFGEDGWLVSSEQPLALAAALADAGLAEVVPSEHVVLLRGEERAVRAALERAGDHPPVPPAARTVELPTVWDGPDLHEVAETSGLAAERVVEILRSTVFTVAFCGFAPGFGYLTGLPDRLRIPRRARPRAQVPAGSVAIAAGYAAVYPTDSPGGWHLLGTCRTVLFDPAGEPPALLAPGTLVRFT